MTRKAYETLNYLFKYDGLDIRFKTNYYTFNIPFRIRQIPHLLGLHYMYDNKSVGGYNLINEIETNKYSDDDILLKVKNSKNHNFVKSVQRRIDTFYDFILDIEDAIVYEAVSDRKKVNYLIVETKNNLFLQLGFYDQTKDLNISIDENDCKDAYFKTYFINTSNKHFCESLIREPIQKIEVYSRELRSYMPFSFDDSKNDLYHRIEDGEFDEELLDEIKYMFDNGEELEIVEEMVEKYLEEKTLNEDNGLSL